MVGARYYNRLLFIGFSVAVFAAPVSAMTPSPRISKDKPVATSGGNGSMVADGSFSNRDAWMVSNTTWIALDIGTGPSRIFFVWNNPAYTWSDVIADPGRSECLQTLSYPVDYTISVSSNSTDGSDGDWITKTSVTGNTVSVRGHLIDFTGARWVRMNIASGGGKLDEIEVFDATNGMEDAWFFAGTSISANAYKSSTIDDNFPTLVNRKHASFHPAMIRGGIPCITSSDFARDISLYLEAAGNCRYWAIEMGTNDAWGGTDANAEVFKSNLQKVVDSCRAHGIEPVIARVLATSSNWQPHQKFLDAVDALTEDNDLIAGPDFYHAALDDPAMLGGDGVHPSDHGAEVMYKLWAEKMDYLYTTVSADNVSRRSTGDVRQAVSFSGRTLVNSGSEPVNFTVYTIAGQVLSRGRIAASGTADLSLTGSALLFCEVMAANGTMYRFKTRFHR
jgi:lysophospholipase L1-like esterase